MEFTQLAATSRKNLGFVRLRSELDDTFVHAANDGSSVRLHECQDSYSTIWAMEELKVTNAYCAAKCYILFRGAYGRYLGAIRRRWFAQSGVIASQRDFDEQNLEAIMWQSRNKDKGVGYLMCQSGDLLSNFQSNRWKVDKVPQSLARPERIIQEKPKGVMKLIAWLQWWCSSGRNINWVVADNDGNIDEDFWGQFVFTGRDASELEKEIRQLVSAPTTICIRAGTYGKPTPLCIEFPNSTEPLNVVLYLNGTPGCAKLKFPDVSHRFGEHEMTGRMPSSEAAADACSSDKLSLLGANDARSC